MIRRIWSWESAKMEEGFVDIRKIGDLRCMKGKGEIGDCGHFYDTF